MLLRLGGALKNKYSYDVEILPFNIIRVKLGLYEFEISSPRIENYLGNPPFGHSSFEVQLSPQFDYKTSFKRRDFSINAMGIEFGAIGSSDEFKFVDPYGGLTDLVSKVLKPCSDEFYYDPVRFLRLLRFNLKFGFKFEGDISKFNLSKLTKHYFFQECLKNFFPMVRLFFEQVDKFKFNINEDLGKLHFLSTVETNIVGEMSKMDVLLVLTFLDKHPSIEDRTNFAIVSGLKTTVGADLERLRDLLGTLKTVDEKVLKRKLRSFNFVELFEDEDLINLCEIHQLYNRHRFGMLDLLLKVSPERHKTYILFKEIFGDETKGKVIATKLMAMVKENNKRSLISLYCHLLVKFDLRPLFPESRFGN